jgi:nicotinamidase-related amidase
MTTALVVIDVQQIMFALPDYPPYEGDVLVDRIASLIAKARASGTPVFYVQHDEGPGSAMHPGTPGFPFHPKLTPQPGDDVTVKNHGSAFHNTDFDSKLRKAGIDTLVICGMQSEYCVDAAVRGARERNYNVILVSDGHSTVDSPVLKAKDIIAHQNQTLNGSYATVKPAAEIRF